MKSFFQKLPLLAVLFFVPVPAEAHLTGGNGMISGLSHPLFGLDHLLAMVAVGILSVSLLKKRSLKLPVTFIGFMIFGAVLEGGGFSLPFLETAIAFSVLVFGALIAWGKKIAPSVALLAVAFFATFHGFGHATEMPQITHPILYGLGFVLSTSLLHVAGVLLARYAQKSQWTTGFIRYSGAAMSMVGIYLLMGF